jgi:hypothetical protein
VHNGPANGSNDGPEDAAVPTGADNEHGSIVSSGDKGFSRVTADDSSFNFDIWVFRCESAEGSCGEFDFIFDISREGYGGTGI